MVDVTIEIKVTRDIGRQVLRHRSFSFQEFSQRYSKDITFTKKEARLQDHKNRQSSLETHDTELQRNWDALQDEIVSKAKDAYDWAIENGIAKEVARVVLPEGLTMSTMYMKGSLRSWIHYLETRTDASTQKEHRILAEMIATEIAKYFAMIHDFVKGNNVNNV